MTLARSEADIASSGPPRNWFMLALVVGLPLLCLALWGVFAIEPLDMVAPVDNIGETIVDTLLGLIAVALFVERALEVAVKSSRSLGRNEKDNALLACDKTVQDRLEQITAVRARIADPELANQHVELRAQLNHANEELEAARQQRKQTMQAIETYRTQTKKIVHIVALIVGIFVATAGVRALDPLFIGDSTRFLVYVDTLLTAGLIAGGADGLHKLIAVATTYFDVSRDRISGKSAPVQ